MEKNLPANVGDPGSISGLGRFPGEGNGNPSQYSCLGNSMDRGALWVIVQGVTRVGHDLATKPPPPQLIKSFPYSFGKYWAKIHYVAGGLLGTSIAVIELNKEPLSTKLPRPLDE